MSKRVCYSCINIYHFIISYILATCVYKDCENILLISNHHGQLYRIYLRLKYNKKPFQQIHVINELDTNINRIFKRIEPRTIDVLHYFSFGFYNKNIISYFDLNRTKIILTEEGLTTYYFKEALSKRKITSIDVNSFSEIMVLHPEILKRTDSVSRLDLMGLLKDNKSRKEIVERLAYLIDYKDLDIKNQYIFIDQPLSKLNYIDEHREKFFLNDIADSLKKQNVDFIIKAHPSDSIKKFKGLDCKVMQTQAPWEFILIYEAIILNKSINRNYISYYSAAVKNSLSMCSDNENCKGYFLYDLLCSKYEDFSWPIIDDYLNILNKNDNIFLIKNIEMDWIK